MNAQPSTPDSPAPSRVREVIALFAERDRLAAAIDALLAAGFGRSDLSILSSHDSIEAAERPENRLEDLRTALGSEIKYLGPLAAAGFIMLAAGPMAAVLAGLVAAGIGGLALKDFIDETTSATDSDNFARALEAGAVILWVRTESKDRETDAAGILQTHGGDNVHVNERAGGAPSP